MNHIYSYFMLHTWTYLNNIHGNVRFLWRFPQQTSCLTFTQSSVSFLQGGLGCDRTISKSAPIEQNIYEHLPQNKAIISIISIISIVHSSQSMWNIAGSRCCAAILDELRPALLSPLVGDLDAHVFGQGPQPQKHGDDCVVWFLTHLCLRKDGENLRRWRKPIETMHFFPRKNMDMVHVLGVPWPAPFWWYVIYLMNFCHTFWGMDLVAQLMGTIDWPGPSDLLQTNRWFWLFRWISTSLSKLQTVSSCAIVML